MNIIIFASIKKTVFIKSATHKYPSYNRSSVAAFCTSSFQKHSAAPPVVKSIVPINKKERI